MTRWISLIVIVIALSAAATFLVQYVPETDTDLAAAVPKPTGPAPKVEIPQELVFDFGTMSQRDKASHFWTVKNVGPGELELWLEGKPTCSCTVAELEIPKNADPGTKKPIKKLKTGEETKITLTWETRMRENHYSQSATFGTNDPAKPTFQLVVKGLVFPPLIVMPPQMITLQPFSNEEKKIARVGVLSRDRPETKVKGIKTSRPNLISAKALPFDIEEQKVFNSKLGYRIEVEIQPGMPIGRFLDEIVLDTDHPLQPELKISMTGIVTGPISVIPEQLRIPNVISKQGATRDLTLLARGGGKIDFTVAHKPKNLDIAITPLESDKDKSRYRLTATVPPNTPLGWIDDEIVLKTTHPKAQELKIKVSIIVTSGAG